MSIFISYSSKEMEIAAKICEYLEENGFECWIAPRNVVGGANYPTQIVNAIKDCEFFLLLASRNTNLSGHVSNEVDIAFNSKKIIIPFRLENVEFTDEYTYFLGRKHRIDAYKDMNTALRLLISDLNKFKNNTPPSTITEENKLSIIQQTEYIEQSEEKQKFDILSREEIVDFIIKKSEKYPYNLYEKINTKEKLSNFTNLARTLFKNTVSSYSNGKLLDSNIDIVSIIVNELSCGSAKSIRVQGLPGSAKNMILQLAFYQMLENYKNGINDYLPIYISASYYEKAVYNSQKIHEQMKNYIGKDLETYLNYLNHNSQTKPVIFVEAIRQHYVSKISPEMVLNEILLPLGNFNRINAIDTGLIKNCSRLKKVIPIAGKEKGYSFVTNSIPVCNKNSAMNVIKAVVSMYEYDLRAEEIYNTFKVLKFSTIDIFLIRLIAKELISSYDFAGIKLTEMYEKLALNELYGDEEKLRSVSSNIFEYMFNDKFDVNSTDYKGAQWSLPHKHNSYLEFLISYYFINKIKNYKELNDYSFFRTMLTSNGNHFVSSFLKNDYLLQHTLLDFIIENYEQFDIRQKSNAAYWLGHITFNNLSLTAISLLTNEFDRLKILVKSNNKLEQINLDNHFLFRSICTGLLLHSQTKVLDDFLCIIVANDIANLINRGSTIEYYGDSYQIAAHEAYYLDSDFSIGEQAIQILNGKIETVLFGNSKGFVEYDLITMLTILQARMQNRNLKLKFSVTPYVEKAIFYIDSYQKKPQNVSSGKIKYYFESIKEDFQNYLNEENFDIGPMVYNKYRKLKEIKMQQWVDHNIKDPESVSEHLYSAWLLAVLFLPDELDSEGYCKKEILDMLLVHDMAEAELGIKMSGLNISRRNIDDRNNVLKKLFLKGTYPDFANLTYYYNVWTGYYNGININSRTARDINLIQTVYTFCEYYKCNPENFTVEDIRSWIGEKSNLMTEIGYEIFDRLIENNSDFNGIIQQIANC